MSFMTDLWFEIARSAKGKGPQVQYNAPTELLFTNN